MISWLTQLKRCAGLVLQWTSQLSQLITLGDAARSDAREQWNLEAGSTGEAVVSFLTAISDYM